MIGPESDDVREIVEQERHVEIDEPDDLLGGNGRVRREIACSEQPIFLAGVGDE